MQTVIDHCYIFLRGSVKYHASIKQELIDYFDYYHSDKDIVVDYVRSRPWHVSGSEHLFKCSYVTTNDPVYEKLVKNSNFHATIQLHYNIRYYKENPWENC